MTRPTMPTATMMVETAVDTLLTLIFVLMRVTMLIATLMVETVVDMMLKLIIVPTVDAFSMRLVLLVLIL